MFKYFLCILFFIFLRDPPGTKLYVTNKGEITFRSEAQREQITASSDRLIGIINPTNRTFVFKVAVRSFQGFNSALQQEHFNEKFLESEKFPDAYFNGKIIEDLDLSINGNYDVRAKGKMSIHGIEIEKIIRSKVEVLNDKLTIESHFSISLTDHNIKIPKVVHEKIASEILIELKAELTEKK